MKHSSLLLTLCLALAVGCDKNKEESENPEDDNLAGVGPREDDPVDDLASEGEDEELFDEEGEGLEAEEGETPEKAAPKKKLPPRDKPVQKCKMVVVRDDGTTVDDAPAGKKKKKPKGKKQQVCKLWDPKPQVSASHGVVALVGEFRWGMSPKEVFKILTKDIEAEYAKRQEAAKTAAEQDDNRKWRQEQLAAVKSNHTKFTAASKHRWGVSLIQYEYADDQQEEMLFVRTGNGLRKFYFFKDGELWKIYYAYSTDVWPGKTYAQVVDEKFFKWFGPSPQEKVKVDPKSKLELLRYYEWTAMENEKIRSFDMTQVHGVIGLAVVDGKAEERIGERLPNIGKEEGYSDVVNDVLGGSDVCYDKSGDIVECGKESEKKNKDIDLD